MSQRFDIIGKQVALSSYSLLQGNWGDFFAWELSNLHRFYKGNLANSKKLAIQRNENTPKENSQKIRQILQHYIEKEKAVLNGKFK